jgi:hypothetical protein
MDGQESIILAYSQASFVVWSVRDELRDSAPGLSFGPSLPRKSTIHSLAVAFPVSDFGTVAVASKLSTNDCDKRSTNARGGHESMMSSKPTSGELALRRAGAGPLKVSSRVENESE